MECCREHGQPIIAMEETAVAWSTEADELLGGQCMISEQCLPSIRSSGVNICSLRAIYHIMKSTMSAFAQ